MQAIVMALLVGLAAANVMDNSPRGMMKQIFSVEAKDMHTCTSDADCAAFPTMTKCGMNFKLCRPAEWPELPMTEGTCTDDSMCKPMRRCMAGTCHFAGPKTCTANTDCLHGVTGMTYECMELAKTAPGMRCYPKCTTDTMCHDRMTSEEFKTKVGCCGGFCQKKTAC